MERDVQSRCLERDVEARCEEAGGVNSRLGAINRLLLIGYDPTLAASPLSKRPNDLSFISTTRKQRISVVAPHGISGCKTMQSDQLKKICTARSSTDINIKSQASIVMFKHR